MHLFIERQNWTFEYTSSSHKSATRFDGTRWPGAHEHILPFYTTATFARGTRFTLNWVPKSKRPALVDSVVSISNNINKPSRVRSFQKSVGKMFHFTFSPIPPSPPPYSPPETDMAGELAELQGCPDVFELPDSVPSELPAPIRSYAMGFDHRASNTNPSFDPVSPVLPDHGYQQQGEEHSVSPLTTRRSSCAYSYMSQATSLSTPPTQVESAAYMDASETQYRSFETAQHSPSSQVVNQRHLSISSSTTPYHPTHYDTLKHASQIADGASRLERHHLVIAHRQHLAGPDTPRQLAQNPTLVPLPAWNQMALPLAQSSMTASDQLLYGVPMSHVAMNAVKSAAKKTKRFTKKLVFSPLPCSLCNGVFKGPYQKGNLKRHFKAFHSNSDANDDDLRCRVCSHPYNRADARRKHEWKEHRLPDACPKKRRHRAERQRDSETPRHTGDESVGKQLVATPATILYDCTPHDQDSLL